MRLVFIDPCAMDLFVKYLLEQGFEGIDDIQKETLSHFYEFTYYSLHGKLFILRKGNITIRLGRTLPFSAFALEGNEQPLAEAITFVLNDITHLIFDEKPQIISKPGNSWNWETHNINTIKEFDEFYDKLLKSEIVCIDTETSNLNKINNKILTVHFSLTGNEAYNIPYLHRQTPFCAEDLEYIKKKLKWYFEFGTSKYLIFHNAKFDLSVFRGTWGVEYFNHKVFDTMNGCYAIDENRKFIRDQFPSLSYSLGHLSEEYGCLAYREGDLAKEDRANMEEHELKSIMQYASKDVVIPYKIHQFQMQEANDTLNIESEKFLNFVINILGEITKTFCDIELNGLLMDVPYTESLLQEDGVLKTIREDILKAFKESKNCQETNLLLHINNDIRDNLSLVVKAIKKALRTSEIKSKISEALKSQSEKLIEYIEGLLKPNSKLTTDFLLYKNLEICFCTNNLLKPKIKEIFDEFKKISEQIAQEKQDLQRELEQKKLDNKNSTLFEVS